MFTATASANARMTYKAYLSSRLKGVEPTDSQQAALVLAAAWDAAVVAARLNANRCGRGARFFAATGYGRGAMARHFLSPSDRRAYGSVCSDMAAVARDDSLWSKPPDPELIFTVGGSANMAQRDVLGVVTALCACAVPGGVLIGSMRDAIGAVTLVNGAGTLVNGAGGEVRRDIGSYIHGIAVLQDGRCIISYETWGLLGINFTIGIAADSNQEFTISHRISRIGAIATLKDTAGDIICVSQPHGPLIDSYRVGTDGSSLTKITDPFPVDVAALQRGKGMCRIPASCPCECGNLACVQDRLAIVDRTPGGKLYIVAPGAGLLHTYDLGAVGVHPNAVVIAVPLPQQAAAGAQTPAAGAQIPIAVAVADSRNELVILFNANLPIHAEYSLHAWKIGAADPSQPIDLRKLEIDTDFCGNPEPCIAMGGGMLFLSGECQVKGYNY